MQPNESAEPVGRPLTGEKIEGGKGSGPAEFACHGLRPTRDEALPWAYVWEDLKGWAWKLIGLDEPRDKTESQ